MINFQCQDTKLQFNDWYEAAQWFYEEYEKEDSLVRKITDRSAHCLQDFTCWVNDNYTAYDILTRNNSNGELFNYLYDKFIKELADDLEDDTYDFCVLFSDSDKHIPEPDPNKKYYRITYSCGCGENEEYIAAVDYDEALHIAYEYAIEDYHCYEGLHGVRTMEQIADEMFGDGDGEDLNLDNLTEEQCREVEDEYYEEIESTIDYYAKEISFEEYLENGGKV